jgi:hypothetical protein
MPITGQLATMPLPDILQWIALGSKTGRLEFRGHAVRRAFYFESGRFVSSESEDPTKVLGQYLIRGGYLTREEHEKAREVTATDGRSLARLLVEIGAISIGDMKLLMRKKLEDEISDVLAWQGGDFLFHEQQKTRADFIKLDEEPVALFLNIQRTRATRRSFRASSAVPVA